VKHFWRNFIYISERRIMRGIYEHKRCMQSVAKQPKRRRAFCFSYGIRRQFAELYKFAKFSKQNRID